MDSLQCVERSLLPKRPKFLPTTHVQMLQWLHGKQQQQHEPDEPERWLLIKGLRTDKDLLQLFRS